MKKRDFAPLTKITRPATAGIFPRRRLFDMLDRSHDRQAVWVSGPAGSGKTTFVASYLDHRELPCLWYQADADDGDISTFFYYLGMAAKRAAPRYRKPLPLLTPEYLQGVPAFTRRYFDNLFARLKPPFALVFDNYQDVPPESAFHDVIRETISIMPEGITAILISRSEPPPSLVRLRANNKIFTIDWNELRLTLDESREIVNKQGPGLLSKEILGQFHARTDGWAAGLVLMMEVFKTKGSDFEKPGISTPHEIFDYFAGEVLDKLDVDTRNFLLTTSFLPAMTVESANKLTGRDNAGRILSMLNRNHLFTEKHVSTHLTYQYHPLFREFLSARLNKSLSPDEVRHIQNRAAPILAEAGRTEESAVLYRDAKNWEGFIPLILGQAQTLIMQGRGQTLQGWIESLPQPLIEQVPWLLFWLGVCNLPFSSVKSKNHFEKAFTLFRTRKDALGSFFSLSGMFGSVTYQMNSFAEYDRLVPMLYELRREFQEYPSPDIEARIVDSMLHVICVRRPNHPDVDYWTERGLSIAMNTTDIDIKMHILNDLSLLRLFSGELEKAAFILDLSRDVLRTHDVTPFTQIMFKDLEAYFFWLTGDFYNNRKATEEGIALTDTTGVHVIDGFVLGHGAAGALSAGDMKRADELLARMRSSLDTRAAAWGENLYHDLIAWKYLLHGDPARASLHADLAIKFGVESGAAVTDAYHHMIKAVVQHELKNDDEASAHLSEARKICGDMKTYQTEFRYLLAEAQFAFDRGTEDTGLKFLRKAMALGRMHGYMNALCWIPSVMARLCVKALEAGIEVEYVQNLVRRRDLVPDIPPLHCGDWPWAVKIFTLGRFGIERNGKLLRFSKKVPKKPIEMLRVLIALGGKHVSETRLNDILWPDADGDSAHRAFNITLIRMRELIGHKEAVELKDGCVTLVNRYVWVDTWGLEHQLDDAEKAQRGASFTPELFTRAIELYKGPFLAEENGDWAISHRERLNGRVMSKLEKLGRHWEEKKMLIKGIDCYRKGLEIDDLAEEFYRRAIQCLLKLGRRAEALSLYRRCEKVLGSYGIKPSSETEAIYKSLISE